MNYSGDKKIKESNYQTSRKITERSSLSPNF
jgi:hypothetical protein